MIKGKLVTIISVNQYDFQKMAFNALFEMIDHDINLNCFNFRTALPKALRKYSDQIKTQNPSVAQQTTMLANNIELAIGRFAYMQNTGIDIADSDGVPHSNLYHYLLSFYPEKTEKGRLVTEIYKLA